MYSSCIVSLDLLMCLTRRREIKMHQVYSYIDGDMVFYAERKQTDIS